MRSPYGYGKFCSTIEAGPSKMTASPSERTEKQEGLGGTDVQPQIYVVLRIADCDDVGGGGSGDCVAAGTVTGVIRADSGSAGHEQHPADWSGHCDNVPGDRETREPGRRQYPHGVAPAHAGPERVLRRERSLRSLLRSVG